MTHIYPALIICLQIIGFVYFCRLGARLTDWLVRRARWLPLAVGAAIILPLVAVALIWHPTLNAYTQSLAFWLVAFGGGVVARSQQLLRNGL